MEQRDLSQLVRDSQAGDSQAQEHLVQAIQNYIYFYCRTMLGNEDAAMDAAQDILVAMLSGLNSLRDPDAFKGWLRQIIIRTCGKRIDRARRERLQRMELANLSLEDEGSLSNQLEPDEIVDREETRRIISELVNALPQQQRLCVLLHYYDEMPVEKIAAALKVPVGTVKSRLYYARRAIKQGAKKYAGQGFLLCGLSPLPFLRYSLQLEASSCLSAAAAASLTTAALAGGTAAGGAALGASVKAFLEVLTSKKAAALAALALMGTITGGVLHQAAKIPIQPPIQTAQPVQMEEPPEISAPSWQEPERPTFPEPSEDLPEPVAEPAVKPTPQSTHVEPPVQPEEEPMVEPEPQLPPEEPAPLLPEEPAPLPPEQDIPPIDIPDILDILPGADPKPEPFPETPSQNPGFDLPVSWPQPVTPTPAPSEPDPVDPAPVEPDPEPEEPAPVEPEPGPEEPGPVEPNPPPEEEPEIFVRERSFVDYQGNGGYGYTTTFANAWGEYLPPVEMTYTSSDTNVVAVNENGEFTTLAPGTAVVSALQETEYDYAIRYDLAIEVEDQFRWEFRLPNLEFCEGTSRFCVVEAASWNKLEGYEIQIVGIDWSVSDSNVVEILNTSLVSCELGARAPGNVEITGEVTFLLDTAAGEMTMKDTLSCLVTVSPSPEPAEPTGPEVRQKELTEFGYASGYGFTNSFRTMWGSDLPENLTGYVSSHPEVVHILETGEFSTLSAGTAELTAVDPDDPEHPYILTVHVQDHLDWTRVICDTNAWLGLKKSVSIVGYSQQLNQKPLSSRWESSDPSAVTAEPDAIWCGGRIYGVTLDSEADITVTVSVEVHTVAGTRIMEDIITFHVVVVP